MSRNEQLDQVQMPIQGGPVQGCVPPFILDIELFGSQMVYQDLGHVYRSQEGRREG